MLTEDELIQLADWNRARAAFYDEAAVDADARTRLVAEAAGRWRRERARYFGEQAARATANAPSTVQPEAHRDPATHRDRQTMRLDRPRGRRSGLSAWGSKVLVLALSRLSG
jgi:hypothetical protein